LVVLEEWPMQVGYRLFFGLLLALSVTASVAAALDNRMRGHASPYLALHGADPVAWQEWNAETVARAKRENKLLFVSLGYFSCHWCHVMQQESYRDPAIAALLNRHFIPVKVDRELNAALDAALIEFSQQLNGVAGWPLNAFVTPEGYPAYAVLYQPPGEFKASLTRLAANWRDQYEVFKQTAREAAQIRPSPGLSGPQPELSAAVARRLQLDYLVAVRQQADTLQGGFSRVSKFPMAPHLASLLEIHARQPEPWLADFLQLTLDQMARFGLRDPVNGGFFRYTVDPDWHTPHFEKMLADNAQLAPIYARAAELFKRPDYRVIAHQTLDFMLETLRAPQGGFYTATSALDKRGQEGGAYLWRPDALRRLLNTRDYELLRKLWRLDAPAPFDLGHLPMALDPPSAAERARLHAILVKLKQTGRQRQVPVDTKINAALNGLALSAFSQAGRGVPRFDAAAHALRSYIEQRLLKQGRLVKTRASQQSFDDAELDDYAYIVAGLEHYATAYRDTGARSLARELAKQAWQGFFSADGWQRERQPLLATMRAQPALPDGALPSASAKLIGATRELLVQVRDIDKDKRQRLARESALPVIMRQPFEHPSALLDIVNYATARTSRQSILD
jgi:uncharacterized protein